VICLGRLAGDLYAQQVGARLEDVSSFAKYLGGSSANIAFGAARLGLKSAMLSRVGNDHMGRFLTESLTGEGCDVSHVAIDPDRLTALVLLGLKDRDTFPLVFYRENCADMAISEADFDEAFIASSKALLITGTHLSTPAIHRASSLALDYARRNNVRTVLDIDYRPVLWDSLKKDGETRFIAADGVTRHLLASCRSSIWSSVPRKNHDCRRRRDDHRVAASSAQSFAGDPGGQARAARLRGDRRCDSSSARSRLQSPRCAGRSAQRAGRQ
jgi:5-dehydro-2-deoxygluconokinase